MQNCVGILQDHLVKGNANIFVSVSSCVISNFGAIFSMIGAAIAMFSLIVVSCLCFLLGAVLMTLRSRQNLKCGKYCG